MAPAAESTPSKKKALSYGSAGSDHANEGITYGLPPAAHIPDAHETPLSWFAALTTYFGYVVLILFGHTRDFFGKLTGRSRYLGNNRKPAKVRVLVCCILEGSERGGGADAAGERGDCESPRARQARTNGVRASAPARGAGPQRR